MIVYMSEVCHLLGLCKKSRREQVEDGEGAVVKTKRRIGIEKAVASHG